MSAPHVPRRVVRDVKGRNVRGFVCADSANEVGKLAAYLCVANWANAVAAFVGGGIRLPGRDGDARRTVFWSCLLELSIGIVYCVSRFGTRDFPFWDATFPVLGRPCSRFGLMGSRPEKVVSPTNSYGKKFNLPFLGVAG